jgi:hypothetical protein
MRRASHYTGLIGELRRRRILRDRETDQQGRPSSRTILSGLRAGSAILIGYALISVAIWFATTHGVFPGATSGKSDNIILGPLNFLVIASGLASTGRESDLGFFFILSFPLVLALFGSLGQWGCMPWLSRFAVLGIWAVADFCAWLVSIPLE